MGTGEKKRKGPSLVICFLFQLTRNHSKEEETEKEEIGQGELGTREVSFLFEWTDEGRVHEEGFKSISIYACEENLICFSM